MFRYLTNRGCKTFWIPENQKKDLVKVWRPFVVILLLILIVSLSVSVIIPFLFLLAGMPNPVVDLCERLVICVLVILSNVLVIMNTIDFISETLMMLATYQPNVSIAKSDQIRKRTLKLIYYYYGTIFASIIIIGWFGYKILFDARSDWLIHDIVNELLSVIVFVAFVCIDTNLLRVCKIAIASNPTNLGLRIAWRFTYEALLLIDLAGLWGIILVAILSLFLFPFGSDLFRNGFSAGAIAIQIVFTQFNYSVLKSFAIRKERVQQRGTKTAGSVS